MGKKKKMTHSSPCSTHGKAQSRLCHLGWHRCKPRARTSHRWSRSSPVGEEHEGRRDQTPTVINIKLLWQPVLPGAKSWPTHPVEADLSLSMAGCEVSLGLRRGALGTDAITHALVSALRLLSALLITTLVGTVRCTTRTLAGTGGKDPMTNCQKWAGRSLECSGKQKLRAMIYLHTLLGFNLHFLLSAWLAS